MDNKAKITVLVSEIAKGMKAKRVYVYFDIDGESHTLFNDCVDVEKISILPGVTITEKRHQVEIEREAARKVWDSLTSFEFVPEKPLTDNVLFRNTPA